MLIDLTSKALPSSIVVGGRAFLIKTDFRDWIAFGKLAKEERLNYDTLCLMFEEEPPPINMLDSIVESLIEFYTASSSTPHSAFEAGGDNVSDLYEDGEYIYASFMSQYGIDLIETDMHWHKFKALLNCLRETKYNDVISYRAYKNSSESYETNMMRLKEMWSLEQVLTDEEREKLKEFDSLF